MSAKLSVLKVIHQIPSAYPKWNEMKSRVRIRLLYSVQAWQLGAEEMRQLESVWCVFLRRLLKGDFSRKIAPKNKKDKSIPEGQVDWYFKLSNEAIREITKMTEIKKIL